MASYTPVYKYPIKPQTPEPVPVPVEDEESDDDDDEDDEHEGDGECSFLTLLGLNYADQ